VFEKSKKANPSTQKIAFEISLDSVSLVCGLIAFFKIIKI
jgi:hypothetical protein